MSTRALAFPLLGAMLLASAASAQTTAASSSVATGSAASNPAAFLTQEQADQWRASKVDGLYVYNDQNQRIGEIKDLVIGRDGHIDAVVIGVGGFLGIDEKDVAVPFDQFTWVEQPQGHAGDGGQRDTPKQAMLNMTKDQLLAAPKFKYGS